MPTMDNLTQTGTRLMSKPGDGVDSSAGASAGFAFESELQVFGGGRERRGSGASSGDVGGAGASLLEVAGRPAREGLLEDAFELAGWRPPAPLVGRDEGGGGDAKCRCERRPAASTEAAGALRRSAPRAETVDRALVELPGTPFEASWTEEREMGATVRAAAAGPRRRARGSRPEAGMSSRVVERPK